MNRLKGLALLVLVALFLTGCKGEKRILHIVSGSENEALEPILVDFEKKQHVDIELDYKGSVDIMNILSKETIKKYDGVWPANNIWISMGDQNRVIRNSKSIMTSPIVFGIKESLAKELGFYNREVNTYDILNAIQSGKLKFMMTSATQSNSGACAYLGFLSAFLGSPDMMTLEDLKKPELQASMKELLSGVERSSGSSGWLKDLFLQGGYDAMVNYEALIIETNIELVKRGEEPLYVIYPVDGLSIADSPLGIVDRGDQESAQLMAELQDYLLSEEIQKKISKLGRRTGIAGVSSSLDQTVFKKEWGIDPSKTLSGITMPSAEIIKQALYLYQTELRKPSFTVFCLDYSGSMSGHGDQELKAAMAVLLKQEQASEYLLQTSKEDLIFVVPFNNEIVDVWQVSGNDQGQLTEMLSKIESLESEGGTDIYKPTLKAMDILSMDHDDAYSKAVVLLTDGESNEGMNYEQFETEFLKLKVDLPVYSILFGEASQTQLERLSELTRGKVFDGKEDLIEAFKKAKGYN